MGSNGVAKPTEKQQTAINSRQFMAIGYERWDFSFCQSASSLVRLLQPADLKNKSTLTTDFCLLDDQVGTDDGTIGVGLRLQVLCRPSMSFIGRLCQPCLRCRYKSAAPPPHLQLNSVSINRNKHWLFFHPTTDACFYLIQD